MPSVSHEREGATWPTAALAVVFLAGAAACSPAEPTDGASTSASAATTGDASASPAVPPEVDRRFGFAATERTTAPPPERFGAPLPADFGARYPEGPPYPPRSYVVELLCASDREMTDRLMDATARATSAGKDALRIAQAVSELVRDCEPTPAYCKSAAVLAASSEASRRLAGATMLAACGRPEDIELYDRSDTNALAVFHYLAARRLGTPKPVFTARVGKAAVELATSLDDPHQLRLAAFTLASFDDRHAAQALVAMRDLAKNHKNQIAVAGIESKDAEAQAMGKEACAALKKDPACVRQGSPEITAPKRAREDLKHPELMDLERIALLARDPHVGRSLGVALEACSRARDTAFACIIRLQLIDRKRASELARKLPPREDYDDRETVAALAKYEAVSALEARLVALGFRPLSKRAGDHVRASAREMLEASGHVTSFDAETDRFPNQHDALLARLARLGGPDLAGFLFEETPPPGGEGDYRLCGYARGDRWCTTAKNLGDWYDLDAVLGLLNAMSRDLALSVRFTTLATLDQTANVIGGPAVGITTLVGEGLLERSEAAAARDKGRAAERSLGQ